MRKLIGLAVCSLLTYVLDAQSYVWVSGEIDNLDKDSIQVNILTNGVTRQFQTLQVAVVKKKFACRVSIDQPYLVSVMDGTNYINGVIESGDSLHMLYDAKDAMGSLQVEGRGSEKFLLLHALSHAKVNALLSASATEARKSKYPFDYLHRIIDSCENYYQQRLDQLTLKTSKPAWQLLEGEVKGTFMYKRYYSIGLVYNESISHTQQHRKSELTPKSEQYLQQALAVDGTYAVSPTYVSQVRNLLESHYEELIEVGKVTGTLVQKYQYLDSLLPGSLRTPVLTLFFARDVDNGISVDNYITLSKFIFSNPADAVYRAFVNGKYEKLMAFKDGIPAPAFTVEDEKGRLVSLASFAGKVVYLDFWFGACGPCHALFAHIKPVKEYFRNNDKVVFLTVSVDDKPVWEKALMQYGIGGYHVFTQNQGRAHAIIKDYRVDGYPTTYLIGPDGKIAVVKPARSVQGLIKEIQAALPQ